MSLLDCIVDIPSHLTKIIKRQEELENKVREYIQDKNIQELVFIASGTSLNASKVTRYFANEVCDFKVTCLYPNEFVNYYNHINNNALYVLVSQGGSTKLVFDALNKVKEHKLNHCTITESLESPIAKASDLPIEMGSVKEPYMYRTLGYSTTVVTCWMLELALAKVLNKINKDTQNMCMNDINKAINNLENIRIKTEQWYENNKFSLLRRPNAIIAGAKSFYEVANEADIKLMEMVPMFTRSFELEELIHGPQNEFNDETLFFLLTDERYDKEKAINIAKFIKNEIGFCAMVGNNTIDDRDLNINLASNNFTAIEEITVFQVIAYYMATAKGRDLKRGVNTSVNKYIKKTL